MARDPYDVYQQFNITKGDTERGIHVQNDLIDVIRRMGFQCPGDVQVELTGSCGTGVGLRGADVDLTVITTNRQFDLDRLAKAVNGFHHFTLKDHIRTSKVPILDLRHNVSQSPIDVSLNKTNGVTMSRLLKALRSRNPLLEPMIVYIKWWSRDAGLIDKKNNFFSGFLFTLMVIFHQQQKNGMAAVSLPPGNCSEQTIQGWVNSQPACSTPFTPGNLRLQVINFFEFYANFDYRRIIDTRTRKCRYQPIFNQLQPTINISDPDDGNNDNCAECVGPDQLKITLKKFRSAASSLSA